MIRDLWVLLRGELLLQLRQTIGVALLVVLPLVGAPGALIAVGAWNAWVEGQQQLATDREEPPGPKRTLRFGGPAELGELLIPDDHLELVVDARVAREPDPPPDAVLAEVSLEVPQGHITWRSDHKDGRLLERRLTNVLNRADRARRDARLVAAGIDSDVRHVLKLEGHDRADARTLGASALGGAVLGVLGFLCVMSATHTALDVVAGEKERGTLETLLVTRAPRGAIIAAKLAVTWIAGVVPAWVGLAALCASAAAGLPLDSVGGGAALRDPGMVGFLLLTTGLIAAQVAGAMVAVSASVPDYRAGSVLSAPVGLVSLAALSAGMVPGLWFSGVVAAVPLLGPAVASRAVLAGDASAGPVAVMLGSSLALGAVSLRVAWTRLERESAWAVREDAAGRRAAGDYGVEATLVFGLAMVLLWFLGASALAVSPRWGTVFTQVGLFGGVAVGAVRFLGLPLADTLSLRRPALADAALAGVVVAAMPAVSVLVLRVQSAALPVPDELAEALAVATDGPLPLRIALFAVLPGVCEELLFRGALMGLLRGRLAPVARVAAVAVMFGFAHLSLHRLLPTAIVGLVLGALGVRSRSIAVPMLAHAGYNAVLMAVPLDLLDRPALGVAGAVATIAALAAVGRARSSTDRG